MTFFERYFAALDGSDPYSSLELVADDVEFSIQWADDDGRSRQFTGGKAELRAFVDAGDMTGWAHHLLFSGAEAGLEVALGETRWDSGERRGTFVAAAELDSDGRMVRYMVGRTPAIAFGAQERMDVPAG
jgi:hypothetical protein